MITEPCQITTWCEPLAEVEAQESVFGDLRQSWVNPVLLLSEVTHVNIKSHDSNHLLDKCGCLRAVVVSTEEFSSLFISDEFANTVGIFHGPAVGDVPVVLHLDGDVEILLAGLFFGKANGRNLWVRKDSCWDMVVRHRYHVIRVQLVVTNCLGLCIGDVLKHV